MEKATSKLELITQYFPILSEKQSAQFAALDDLYKEWNKKINVISRKDIDSLYEKHVLHSLSIPAMYAIAPKSKVLDIGTGGGFPGIPLAIYFPDVNFHLIDSIGKKIRVVEAVASALGLSNVTAQQIRAEEITPNGGYDLVVSRAVAPLKELWKLSKPLLKPVNRTLMDNSGITIAPSISLPYADGLLCLKGGDLNDEIIESGCRPAITAIYKLFPLEYFHKKYLLQLS